MSIRREWQSFDYALLLLVCAFTAFGIVMIGAAMYYWDQTAISGTYTTQKIFFATGVGVLILFTVVDYHFIARFHWPIYGFMIILLCVVMVIGTDDITHTARWIRLGSNNRFAIQPSEFSKIFIIVFLAKFIDNRQDSINNIGILGIIAVLAAIPIALIYKQPALSACLVILAITLCVIFSSSLKFKYILIALLVITPILILSYWDLNNKPHKFIDRVLGAYQMGRIETFLDPDVKSDEYRQTYSSLRSIGSGMLEGKGYKQGSYVPMGWNDFIFSVIAEQFGFIGCACVLMTMLLIIGKCILIANRAPDMLGRLIAMGVAGKLAFEVFVNVGVATDILPNTGMPFPFLSSGGSSMWVNMACIGLVLNVGLFRAKSIFKE